MPVREKGTNGVGSPASRPFSRPRARAGRREIAGLSRATRFYEPPTALHSVSRNPNTDKRTKIIVFMVADQKNPSTVAE
jgi:hypothetical protein